MPKIKKLRKRKTFQYNKNRKRLRNNITSTGKIKDPLLENVWEEKQTVVKNLTEMGLSLDPNKTITIPNTKQERLKIIKVVNGFIEEEIDPNKQQKEKTNSFRSKDFVVQKLENEANKIRESQLRLPKGFVSNLSYFLDKYQLNYKAMVKDRKNYDQWTWKQFRSKIRKFMSIQEQFNKYLKDRNLDPENLNWKECDSDDDE